MKDSPTGGGACIFAILAVWFQNADQRKRTTLNPLNKNVFSDEVIAC
jgi:hypothetical protein